MVKEKSRSGFQIDDIALQFRLDASNSVAIDVVCAYLRGESGEGRFPLPFAMSYLIVIIVIIVIIVMEYLDYSGT